MDGTHPHAGDVRHLVQPLAHLPRRLVGEGDGKDIFGRDLHVGDKVGDARGQNARLAAARAREHEHGALGIQDGRVLFFIEFKQFFHTRPL